MNWLDEVKWDEQGLVPGDRAGSRQHDVLMFAWMNREALEKTAELGRAVYCSRSRDKLWHKGEESGHVQKVHEIRLDCDNDVVLLKVTQLGHDPASPATPAATAVSSSCYKDGAVACHRAGPERPGYLQISRHDHRNDSDTCAPGGRDRKPQAAKAATPRRAMWRGCCTRAPTRS